MGVECVNPDPDGSMDAEADEHDGEGSGERWFLSERAPLTSLDFFAGRLSKDSRIELDLRFFSVVPSCCSRVCQLIPMIRLSLPSSKPTNWQMPVDV